MTMAKRAQRKPKSPAVDSKTINVRDIVQLIDENRYRFSTEKELQAGIAQVLREILPVNFEVKIDNASRIDLVVGDIGIEVKISGGVSVEKTRKKYGTIEKK